MTGTPKGRATPEAESSSADLGEELELWIAALTGLSASTSRAASTAGGTSSTEEVVREDEGQEDLPPFEIPPEIPPGVVQFLRATAGSSEAAADQAGRDAALEWAAGTLANIEMPGGLENDLAELGEWLEPASDGDGEEEGEDREVVEHSNRLQGVLAKAFQAFEGTPETWIGNVLHIGGRHGVHAAWVLLARELAAKGMLLSMDKYSEQGKAALGGTLMGLTAIGNLLALAYTRKTGTSTRDSDMGLTANFALMVAGIAVAGSTGVLAPMAPIAAKAMLTGAVRDGLTTMIGLDNNQDGVVEPSWLSMTADSVLYAGTQILPTALFYSGFFLSGNAEASKDLTWRESAWEATKFAGLYTIPEFGNGLSFPGTTVLWGKLVEGATPMQLKDLKLRIKLKFPSLHDLMMQAGGVMLARVVYIQLVNAGLLAINKNVITPERLGDAGYNVASNAMNCLLCFVLYYPWILACTTKARPTPATDEEAGDDQEEGEAAA
jgi:hypothetical protein